MKLIGLFGLLLAISPVFAAETGTCAEDLPSIMTAPYCVDERCTFVYAKTSFGKQKVDMYRSCAKPDAGVNCDTMKSSMNDCLSHQCSYLKIYKENDPSIKPKFACLPNIIQGVNYRDQPPRKIQPL
ncbi:hypothetical protein LRAMOSA03141 [Lichtheimia ramosa]|uniref:Extracellular membrane protein CFEM domain-containing protein n=1 Tax=Lichtheimia ramosa TaxID=688394 RepID=A0A077WT08_9FUNG|nr:hypothetical protein LRAMOSA03141 [Lichtheimia ramosa]